MFEAAFILFRLEKDVGSGKVRLKRVKESIFDSEEKLFALPDTLDEENGPYADLLDHLTRSRVKLLNDLFDFESKLLVDEVEDEIREDQNASFIEGKAIHTFEELIAVLDYMPAGHEVDEEAPAKDVTSEDDDEDLPELDEEEEEKLKNDESLKWDEDEESEGAEGEGEKDKDDMDDMDDEPRSKSSKSSSKKSKGKR